MAKKRIFAPYTKEQARKIVKNYFRLNKDKTDEEIEQLSACAIREGIEVGKYIYNWQNNLICGQHGHMNELRVISRNKWKKTY